MRATLKVYDGPGSGLDRAVPVGASIRVGRSPLADFVIANDDYLSSIHFLLTNAERNISIADLKSRNGLFVNGVRVETAILQDGDQIAAGRSRFTVEFEVQHNPGALLTSEGLDELNLAVLRCLCGWEDPLFALIDAAHGDEVLTLVQGYDGQYQCLYEGSAARDFASYAPYLMAISPGSNFLRELIRQGWSKSWASYFISRQPFTELRKHFQRFLTVETPEGRPSLFRFYDPRVLRSFLPTLQGPELTDFFGPNQHVLLEDEDPSNLLRFSANEPCKGEIIRLNSRKLANPNLAAEQTGWLS